MAYFLNAKDIDEASKEVVKFLTDYNVSNKNVTRIRLGIEDTLIRYQEHFGSDTEFVLRCTKFLGNIKVSVSIKEEVFYPYSNADEGNEANSFMRNAMFHMGNLPVWKYSHGQNTASFYAEKMTIPSWASILIAIVLALAFGMILKTLQYDISSFVCEEIIAPLMDCFMNVIKAVASPLICLAVIWGISSIGDTTVFGVVGKKFTRRIILSLNAFVAFAGIVSLLVFLVNYGEGQQSFVFGQVYRMILDILPADIISPFINGNTLQVFFIGVVVGLALLVAGDRAKHVTYVVEELNNLVQLVMGYIGKLVPVFVFGSILNLFVLSDFSQIKSSYILIIVNLIVYIIVAVVVVTFTGIKLKVSPILIWKKITPAMLIGLLTGSSAAALSEILTCCTDRFGINRGFTNFGAPLSQVTFKSGTAMLYMITAVYVASIYNVEISISWCITALIVCVLLGIATPPVTGGATVAFSVLFMQLNLPTQYMAIIITIATLVEFFSTAINVMNVQCQMLLSANSFKYIDREILEKE